MAQDGYARHGLHKHHVGCSAQGHGWRGQICQVVWRIMRKIRGWHFFSSGLLFRSLKGNAVEGETTSGKHPQVDPQGLRTPPFVWGQTPQATKPWAVCKGHVVQKGHRKCHFFRVPPKKTEESEENWLGNCHPITHVLDPWWSRLVYAGPPQDCWSTKSGASLDG